MRSKACYAISFLIIVSATAYIGPRSRAAGRTLAPPWLVFAPPDEEITFAVPSLPSARIAEVNNNYLQPQQERMLAHCEYSGYGEGLNFIVHSFKAEHPERFAANRVNYVMQFGDFERDLSIDGIVTKLYRTVRQTRNGGFTQRSFRFTTKHHVYLITVITLENSDPVIDHFLASLHSRKDSDVVTQAARPDETVTAEIFSNKEVTRPAIVVWKDEPSYTEAARRNHVVGTVVIDAVFGPDGYVANITIGRGLKDGLNESAIDVARTIRFFPALKDGKPVSQRTSFEYNFNLY
ncbi:MAG TPA: energy transducer TonB [Pyrinomonadaceae bacterium]|jgi:TonB family protein|nr:energy transducer TonB [Pyrinomonadaceae bacterium]